MKRIFPAWLFTLLIGSFLLGVISFLINQRIDELFVIAVISLILSAICSLPLLITELIAAGIQQNKEKSFKNYELAKYIVASITLLFIFFGTFFQTNEEAVIKYGSFIIGFCYGIPGYILHLKYIKPVLFNDNYSSQVKNEDLLDS